MNRNAQTATPFHDIYVPSEDVDITLQFADGELDRYIWRKDLRIAEVKNKIGIIDVRPLSDAELTAEEMRAVRLAYQRMYAEQFTRTALSLQPPKIIFYTVAGQRRTLYTALGLVLPQYMTPNVRRLFD